MFVSFVLSEQINHVLVVEGLRDHKCDIPGLSPLVGLEPKWHDCVKEPLQINRLRSGHAAYGKLVQYLVLKILEGFQVLDCILASVKTRTWCLGRLRVCVLLR